MAREVRALRRNKWSDEGSFISIYIAGTIDGVTETVFKHALEEFPV